MTSEKNKKQRRKTKIISTLGPASKSPEIIRKLILAGVNVFRLNFSHGSQTEHLETFKLIKSISEEVQIPVGILQDLAGPKVRITELEGSILDIYDHNLVSLRKTTSNQKSNHQIIYTEKVDPPRFLKAGNQILLADGIMELEVKEVRPDEVICLVKKGGRLRSRVGICFPDSIIDLPATTDKDLLDFKWGLDNEVDFIAVSFVQRASDITKLTEMMRGRKHLPLLIAKIEMKTAMENIEEIIEAADGIMVARGDLGVELPVEKLPTIQKQLISKANIAGKPVIVATQMLHSMVLNNRPTRAEVTDVANAVNSGTDAVMLSEETAIGNYPVESVQYLDRIAKEAEKEFIFDIYKIRFSEHIGNISVPDAIAYAACAAAHRLNAGAIATCTETGYSARMVAKYRPQQPLFGLSTRESSVRRMNLYWGVKPILVKLTDSHNEEVLNALKIVKESEELTPGSLGIITGGLNVNTAGSTSVLDIRLI